MMNKNATISVVAAHVLGVATWSLGFILPVAVVAGALVWWIMRKRTPTTPEPPAHRSGFNRVHFRG
jgi:hypothetical protein